MNKTIPLLFSLFVLLMPLSAMAIEIGVDPYGDQSLILTKNEFESINDEDVYKLLSGVWGFEIGKRIENTNLIYNKVHHDIPWIFYENEPELLEKLSMFGLEYSYDYNGLRVNTCEMVVVVDGQDVAKLNLFTLGKDNICFAYRLHIYRGGTPVYMRDSVKNLIHYGDPEIKNITLPSGEVLKAVEVENYVQGLYIDRFSEVFSNLYEQISNHYDSALARKPEILERYKDSFGLGIYKFGMTEEEVRIIDEQAKETPSGENLTVYTAAGRKIFRVTAYRSGNYILYFNNVGILAIRKLLDELEIQPTAEHIMNSYHGEVFNYNTPETQHLPPINVIIGNNANNAYYMMDISGLGDPEIVVCSPWLHDRVIEIIKEEQEQENARRRSALE